MEFLEMETTSERGSSLGLIFRLHVVSMVKQVSPIEVTLFFLHHTKPRRPRTIVDGEAISFV